MDTTVGAYEAKTHLSSLLDRVEKGESVMITRNGRPVARLVPAETARPTPAEISETVAALGSLRAELAARGIRVTPTEIRDWIEAGRR
jgi:prevent-host-death family protein